MHETGMIRKLIEAARAEAGRQGGRLCAVQVRLGALAGGSAAHLREHFELELERLGLTDIRLDIEQMPTYPGGVEITSIELIK